MTPFCSFKSSREAHRLHEIHSNGVNHQEIVDENVDVLSSDGFSIVKSFSSGIIIGVAFIHLLNDASVELSEKYDYPGQKTISESLISCLRTTIIV